MKLCFVLRFRDRNRCRNRGGFTLIELLVSIGLIGILVTLALSQFGTIRNRAEKVVCMGHLRSLYVMLSSYLNDNEEWPQCPDDAEGSDEEQFWMDALKDYGATDGVWKCPGMRRCLAIDPNATTTDVPRLSYMITPFTSEPLTPRKSQNMPWVMESVGAHVGLMIRTDGCITTDRAESGE